MTATSPTPVTPLRRLMAERGLTVRELADLADVCQDTICDAARGRRLPTYAVAERLADALEVDVAQLWPDRDTTALAHAIAERGMGVEELAAAAGVSLRAAERWLTGKSRPGPEAAARLFALGLPVAQTLTVDEVLALPSQEDPRWRKRALCATSDNPDLWWPEPNNPGTQARSICTRCPVITSCRDDFLANPYPDDTCIVAGVKASTLLLHVRRNRRKEQAA
jgi:transcriptional regulator with XRE-family HTH domain